CLQSSSDLFFSSPSECCLGRRPPPPTNRHLSALPRLTTPTLQVLARDDPHPSRDPPGTAPPGRHATRPSRPHTDAAGPRGNPSTDPAAALADSTGTPRSDACTADESAAAGCRHQGSGTTRPDPSQPRPAAPARSWACAGRRPPVPPAPS